MQRQHVMQIPGHRGLCGSVASKASSPRDGQSQFAGEDTLADPGRPHPQAWGHADVHAHRHVLVPGWYGCPSLAFLVAMALGCRDLGQLVVAPPGIRCPVVDDVSVQLGVAWQGSHDDQDPCARSPLETEALTLK